MNGVVIGLASRLAHARVMRAEPTARYVMRDTTVEMQQRSIRQRRGPTIKFTGALIAKTEFDIRGGLEMRLSIWQTQGGALIAVSSTEEETRATVVEPGDEMEMRFAVMDAFDWADRARTMVKEQLKWKLHREVE